MINLKKSYLKAYETLKHFIEDDENIVKTIKISQELSKTYLNGGKSSKGTSFSSQGMK